jgi:hypothetical protein
MVEQLTAEFKEQDLLRVNLLRVAIPPTIVTAIPNTVVELRK